MEFRLLGPVEVVARQRPVDLGHRRQRLVLAVLALEANRLVPISRLIELSWPQAPPRTAIHAVRVAASQLRTALVRAGCGQHGVDLAGRGCGYLLRAEAMDIDAHRFRALVQEARAAADDERKVALLRQALGLWRGPVLTGIAPDDTRDTLGRGLEEARLVALEDRIEAELRLARHRELLDELTGLVEAHPLRERLTAQLMLALYWSGQAGAALEAFRRTRRRLADELGIDPGAELRRLEVALLRNDSALAEPRQPAPGGGPAGGITGPDGPGRTPADHPAARGHSPAPGQLPTGQFPPVQLPPWQLPPGQRPASELPAPSWQFRLPGWLPPPAQLPPAVADFTGRTAELVRLTEFSHGHGGPAPAGIIAITGPAGVGKTALAVHWASLNRCRFGDGQLFIDLRGFACDPPVSVAAALGRFLRALGTARADVPEDPDEAAALYRSLLADRQMLIVIDNAAAAQQVRPLLPATPGCLVIVTSRDRLTGLAARDGARCLGLDLLPPEEARSLLARVIGGAWAGADARAADRLALACGYLPLALRIAAAQLAACPPVSIGARAAALAQGDPLAALQVSGDELATLPAVLGLSYARLGPDTRRLFRLAAVAPCPDLTVATAAILAAIPAALAGRLLAELACAHLLREDVAGRFAVSGVFRGYARLLAAAEDSEPELGAAVLRLLEMYAATAAAAWQAVGAGPGQAGGPAGPDPAPAPLAGAAKAAHPLFAGPAEATAWLADEYPNLAAVRSYAAEHGRPDLAGRLADPYQEPPAVASALAGQAPSAGRASLAESGRDGTGLAGPQAAAGPEPFTATGAAENNAVATAGP